MCVATPTEHGEDEILQHAEWLRHLLWSERDPTPNPGFLAMWESLGASAVPSAKSVRLF